MLGFLLLDALPDVLDVLIPAALQLVPVRFSLLGRLLGRGGELGGVLVGALRASSALALSFALSSEAAALMLLSPCSTRCLSSLKRSDADMLTTPLCPPAGLVEMKSRPTTSRGAAQYPISG